MKKWSSRLLSAPSGGSGSALYRAETKGALAHRPYSAFRIPSTIFLASPKSIMVLSRKKSSFSTPA